MADDNELPEEELPPVDPQPEPEPGPVVARYALVQDGQVLNVTLWDGVEPLELPEGQSLVACGDDPVGPGWAWDEEGGFVALPIPSPPFRRKSPCTRSRRPRC